MDHFKYVCILYIYIYVYIIYVYVYIYCGQCCEFVSVCVLAVNQLECSADGACRPRKQLANS